MKMKTTPAQPRKYVLNASSFDFTNAAGTNGKDEVEVTWLNGKKEVLDLDNAKLALSPDINTLTKTEGTKTVIVNLIDEAGNNIKDKDNNDVTTTFNIEVGDGLVDAVISGDMTKKAYNVGDNIDLTGLEFYEKYGSTPVGNQGTLVTYPNSKITIEDITSGMSTAFTTNLPESEFNSTTHISTRQVKITFTPDSTKPELTQTKTVTVTVYNQVDTAELLDKTPQNYDLNETMKIVEIAVTRKAQGSVAEAIELSSTDIGFDSSIPGSYSKTYNYVDNGNVDGQKTFTITYTYTVNDARTSVTIDGTLTNSNYNWGEGVDFTGIKVYEKFASNTDITSPGTEVSLTDSRIKIEDITNVTTPVNVTNNLSQLTTLAESEFDGNTHKALRTIQITFTADPTAGTGVNNVAIKTVNINVLNNFDHIEISNDDEPKSSFSVNENVTNPGGKIVIYRAANKAASTETKPIEIGWLNGTIDTTTQGMQKTATITYEENDIHGNKISDAKTYKYDVVDTSKGATFVGTFTKNKYDWGETLDLSEIKLYEKFASTPEGDNGVEINLNDSSKVKIEDVTDEASGSKFDATTELMTNYFDNTHWATRKVRISYIANDGRTYTKEIEIMIFDTVDHITISDDPRKTYAIGASTSNPGGKYKVYRKSSPNTSAEEYPITESLLNGTLSTSVVTTNATATVTHEEENAHGIKKQYPATFTYTVADVVTKIEVKSPQPKITVRYGEKLKDTDLAGVMIEVYKGGTAPVDTVQVTASMVSGLNINVLGIQYPVITYGQDLDGSPVTTTIEVEVVDYVEDIILVEPTTTTYEVNDNLNLAGATLQKIMASKTPCAAVSLTDEIDLGRAVLGTYDMSTTGAKTIDVTWEGYTKSFSITVKDETKTITLTPPTKTNYQYGESNGLNLSGGKITITGKTGNSEIVLLNSPRVTLGTYTLNTLTPQTIDVLLDGVKIGDFTINISDYVSDIILTRPTKVEYEYGETLDLTGGTLQKVMASGKKGTVESLTDEVNAGRVVLGTYTTNKVGTESISVTWEGHTKAFGINISDNIQKIEIENYPKITHNYGMALDVTDVDGNPATIKVTRSSGVTYENITSGMVTGYNPNKLGAQTLTVTYKGATVQYGVNVVDYITGIEIKKPTKLTYEVGDTLDLTGGTVKYLYAAGTLDNTPVSMTDTAKVTVTGGNTDSVGTSKVTVEYGGYTKDFYITVKDGIDNITLTPPTKTDYLHNDELNLTGGKVTITTKAGTEETILLTDKRVTISNYSKTTLGAQTLDVLLDGDKVGEFTVIVEDFVKEFKVIPPNKTDYEWGEELNLDGGKVRIIMSSGAINEEESLAGYMVSGYDKEKEGTQKIIVSYKGHTGTFDVKVVDEVKSIKLLTLPDKTEYEYGEDIDVAGATIEVVKSSGIYTVDVTRDMIEDYNARKSGIQTVTVKLGNATDTFTVEVGEAPNRPSTPDTPDIPDVPDTPDTPNMPDIPDTPTPPPAIPEQPAKPTKPTKPQTDTKVIYVEKETPKEEPVVEEPKEEKPIEQTPVIEEQKEEERPTEVLGVKDETKDSNIKIKAGITSLLGLFVLLLLLLAKRNVKVYVEEGEEFEFGGMDKLTKRNRKLNIDKYIDGETYQNRVLIRLNDAISEKLDGKEIEIKHRGITKKFTVKYSDKPYEIVLE